MAKKIFLSAVIVLSASILLQAWGTERPIREKSLAGHIEVKVTPESPATMSSTTVEISDGWVVPSPGPPTTQEAKECTGQSLITCLNVINLDKISGIFRLPTTNGLAEFEVKDGKIISIKIINHTEQNGLPSSTRDIEDGGKE